MVRRVFARFGAGLLAALTFAGCSPESTAPLDPARIPSTPSAGLLGLLLPVKAVTRSTPLAADIKVSAVIGRAGGSISIPQAGLTLVVPPGAVASNVTFTATALAGRAVAYDFQPHGMKFAVPLKFTQDLRQTSLLASLIAPLLDGAYFADNGQIDQKSGLAIVNELLPATVDLLHRRVGFGINHFSGYLISWH